MLAYKLMRKRKDGTLGSLFINRKAVYPVGKWMWYKDIPTPGYARRAGWHLTPKMHAPHLSTKGRVWVACDTKYTTEHKKPESQGGTWILAKRIKILGEI